MNYSQIKRNIDDMELYQNAVDAHNLSEMHDIERRHGCYGLHPDRVGIKLHDDIEACKRKYLSEWMV